MIDDIEAFVAEVMQDPDFPVKQKPLASLLSVNQATVSRWLTRAASAPDVTHAQ